MGLERIGVQAVVDNIGGYLNDINKLNKATSDAGDQTEKAAKKSEAMTKALQGVGQVVAGLGLTGLFAGMIKSAGESELAVSELNAVIKSTKGVAGITSQAAQDLSTSLQTMTRFSDETILSGESMLLTFDKIGKKTFPRATKAVLDYATKFGSVEQAAVAIGKALQDPIAGVTNLRRVGVMLTDQQEELVKQFVAVGDVAGAQNIILTELEKEFGGLAVAAGKTLPGKFDILRNKFDDVMEVAGGKLAPALGKVVDFAGKLIDQMGDAAPVILLVAGAIGVLSLALGPLGAVFSIILSPLGLIIGAVAALGLAFSTNFLGIRDLVTSVWNFLQPIFADIIGFFQNLFAGVDPGAMLTDLKQRLKMALEQMFSSLGIDYRIVDKVFQNLQNIADWFTQTAVPAVLDFISTTVIPGIQDFIDTLARIWTDVSPFLSDLMNWFQTEGLPFIQGAIDWFVQNVAQPFIHLLSGLWTVVEPALSSLYDWFKNTGLPTIQGLLNDFWQNVLKPVVQLFQDIWDKYAKPGLEALAKFFQDNGPQIGQVISTYITTPLNALLEVIKSIISFAADAIAKVQQLINMQGAWPGIQQNSNIIGQRLSSGQSSVGDVVTAFLNATAKQIFGHDYAGPYSANQPYLVGTGAQPELFMPKSAGFAIPNFSAGALAAAMPVSSPSSYAYNNTYNNQSQMGDINFNGVGGTDDAMRRYALLRAMGRVK